MTGTILGPIMGTMRRPLAVGLLFLACLTTACPFVTGGNEAGSAGAGASTFAGTTTSSDTSSATGTGGMTTATASSSSGLSTHSSSSTTSAASSSTTSATSSSTTSTSTSSSSTSTSSSSSSGTTGDPATCPGEAVSITKGTDVNLAGTTVGASDKFTTASGGMCQTNTYVGADLIYAVVPTTSGMLTATLITTYNNPLLHVRTACPGQTNSDVACSYGNSTGNQVVVKLAVNAGTTYYVAADSWGNTTGGFTLLLALN